jgi:hypothetical protein
MEILLMVIGLLIVIAVLIIRNTNIYVTTQAVIGIDGVEREQRSFSANSSNSLIGQTLGRAYCNIQSALFRRAEARRERAATAHQP